MLELKELTKKYGNFTAVNRLNLTVKKGEIFGFLGPNGAGKTTTINMMCGLITITGGDALLGGVSVTNNPIEFKKKTALIPDKPYMFEKLRGIEYIEFNANLYGVEEREFKDRYEKYSRIFGIEDYVNDFIESYSHGMSQKLLITASLIHRPQLFVLDEPMVGLDPKSQKVLKAEMKKLAKSGMTIFMSTHSLSDAEEVCTNAGIIYEGKLIETGTISAIKRRNRKKKLEEIFFSLTEGR